MGTPYRYSQGNSTGVNRCDNFGFLNIRHSSRHTDRHVIEHNNLKAIKVFGNGRHGVDAQGSKPRQKLLKLE